MLAALTELQPAMLVPRHVCRSDETDLITHGSADVYAHGRRTHR